MSPLVGVVNRHPDEVIAGATSVMLLCLLAIVAVVRSGRRARRAERAARQPLCPACSRQLSQPAAPARTQVMQRIPAEPLPDATAVYYRVDPVDERGRYV